MNGRVMLCAALLATALLSSCSPPSSTKDTGGEKETKAKVIWTCSMHPQIHENHPGSCPICGMALVPQHSQAEADAPAAKPLTVADQTSPATMNPLSEAVIHLDDARSSVASIQTSSVEHRAVQRTIELFGEIAYIPDRHVDFTWYYSGRVEKVLIDYNTTEVQSGQPILQVYSEAAVEDQRTYLQLLRERWQSTFYQRKLYETQLASIAERLFRVGMTADEFKDLERKGRVQYEFIIRAPRSGSIMGNLPGVGERFTSDKVLFHIAPLDEVWFVADVYEQDLGVLKLGQQISIKCPAHPNELFKGKLVYIDRQVDPQKRTVKARFLVSNPRRMLLPQLSATGILQMGTPTSLLAIPASAVIDTGKRQLVYVESAPHTYELRPVTIGPEGEIPSEGSTRWVPVLKGLEAGEKVVSSGAFLIDAEAQMQGLPASGAAKTEAAPNH